MKIEPFALERFFARHEFSARYLLCSSDCEPLSMAELLDMGDAHSLRLWRNLRLGYTETMGHPELRDAVARLYDGGRREDVLVVVPEEGIFLLMQALLSPGDHVVCTFPGYQSLYEVARSMGCEVSPWTPDEASGWRFDVRALDSLVREHTRLLVVNFPHNPTGCLPDRASFDGLLAWAEERRIRLLSDEMYRFLELDPRNRLPSAFESSSLSISLGGLSKSFGLPGLRVGWVVTQDHDVLARMSRLKDYTTICNSSPSEILALAALRSRDRILHLQRDRIHRNIGLLDGFFDEHRAVFRWNRPKSGTVCFPRMAGVEDTGAFCDRLVEETGVLLAPSRVFHYGDRHVRFGFGREGLAEGLERLSDHLGSR